ncbi:MAG: hypothetical protein H5T99_05225 [Moorella sp. (in: Bacteria)]|nr:hypothetical protein [Moorella sp. (in: firmicutes)]
MALDRQNSQRDLFWTGVLFVLGLIMGFFTGLSEGGIAAGLLTALLYGYFLAGSYWGWKALNAITPNVFLILPLIGWFFYFGIKFVVAFCIGWVVMPIKLYPVISQLVKRN